MATNLLSNLLGHLRTAALLQDERTDSQLLESFITQREEAAFEALVRRHGAMVWGVCRRILHHNADAEDAFQATFLVFVRKSAAITDRAAVGNWLYGVARNAAMKARDMNSRRRTKEQQVARMPRPTSSDDAWEQLRPLLDNELGRLPDKYRLAIVLCDLEGTSVKDAARQLGCPQGTVASRLARGREMLAQRLARKGLAFTASVLASLLVRKTAWASVPAPLLVATLKATLLAPAGQALSAGAISAKVAAITQGVLNTMSLTRVKLMAMFLMVLGALGTGVGEVAYLAEAGEQAEPPPAAKEVRPPEKEAKAPDKVARDPNKNANEDELRAVRREHRMVMAGTALHRAQQAAETIEDKQWKAWTLQAIGEQMAKSGSWRAAPKTFQAAIEAAKEIKDPQRDDGGAASRHTLTWIAVAQAEAGDLKSALATLEGIAEDGDRDYGMAALACAQARAKDFKGAEETAEKVSFDRKDWVRTALVTSLAEVGKLKEAAQIVEKIGSDPDKAKALASLASGQVKAKDRAAAKKSLQEARQIADRIEEDKNSTARSDACRYVAEVQAEMGDVEEARRIAGTIAKEQWKNIALRSIVSVQAKAGDIQGAIKTSETIEQEYEKGEAMKEILTAQLRSVDLKGGLQTAAAIKSVYWRVVALGEIAKAQAKAGHRKAATSSFQKAFEVAGGEGENVRNDEPGLGGLRNGALCLLVRAQAEAGEESEAFAWALKQTSPLLKAQALLGTARGIAQLLDTEKRP